MVKLKGAVVFRSQLGDCIVSSYEIPSKCALIKYVLECASDVGCCMKPAKTIGDSQKTIRFLIAHACAFCGVGIVFA